MRIRVAGILLGVILLAGCARHDPAPVRQIAADVLAFYDAAGFSCDVDAADISIRWVDLSKTPRGPLLGLVPWARTILLDERRVVAPFDDRDRNTIAHEVAHVCSIERLGRGPVGWQIWYSAHQGEEEADARYWAKLYVNNWRMRQ